MLIVTSFSSSAVGTGAVGVPSLGSGGSLLLRSMSLSCCLAYTAAYHDTKLLTS